MIVKLFITQDVYRDTRLPIISKPLLKGFCKHYQKVEIA